MRRLFFVLCCVNWSSSVQNNVCRTFEDYNNKDNAENCWFDPDVSSTPRNVAANHGFNLQTHKLETADHYYLTLFRVEGKFSSGSKKQPVLLHHGLMSNCMAFMLLGNQSLAFYLANRGYDVWLANHRGTDLSAGHRFLNMSNPKYWDFSFHEIALYDIPATLQYISNKTGNTLKIVYVGHSMGTTISFIYATIKNSHAEKYLAAIISLSPVASMKNLPSPFRPYIRIIKSFVSDMMHDNVSVLFPYPKRLGKFLTNFCSGYPEIRTCRNFAILFVGEDDRQNLSPEKIPVLVSYNPSRTPVKNVLHYLQIIDSGRFQQFDHGKAENFKKYKSGTPPVYDVSKIRVPVHVFYGLNDHLVHKKDVFWLFNKLKVADKSMNLVPADGSMKEYNHVDFLIDKRVEKNLHEPLLKILKNVDGSLQ